MRASMVHRRPRGEQSASKLSVSYAVFGAFAVVMMLFLMSDSQAAIEHMRRGMLLCVRTMIPSLFPFMVVSELVVRSGAGEAIARILSRLLRPVFGLSEQGVCALFLGALCGFPVGSRAAASFYRTGRMSRREFNHVLCFCNVPSSAFLVSAVGLSLFGSTTVGWWLLGLALASAAVVGVVFRVLLPRRIIWQQHAGGDEHPNGALPDNHLLPSSIASAAGGMLNVCATVLLFSAFIGSLTRLCDLLALSSSVRAAVFGVFELSTGVCAASSVESTVTAMILCAAMVGWAGLSVHCQILAVCDGCPVSMGWFWLARALQAVLCALGMAVLIATGTVTVHKIPEPMAWRDLMVGGGEVLPGTGFSRVWCLLWGTLFLTALVAVVVRRMRKRKGG